MISVSNGIPSNSFWKRETATEIASFFVLPMQFTVLDKFVYFYLKTKRRTLT